jgi:phage terminase large subunit GpA-like protein
MQTKLNSPERIFYGRLLSLFRVVKELPTIEWARKYRFISNEESSLYAGPFDHNKTPYMEYVYDCLDNPYIPIITAQKSTRVGWTETASNYRGKRIHTNPTSMMLAFSTKEAARDFAKKKWSNFLKGAPILKNIINVGVTKSKESYFEYIFPNGSLSLVTVGAIASQKSNNYELIEIEEPDDIRDDIQGQGDTFSNLSSRQKSVPLVRRKFIFGGTPTIQDFSRVEKARKLSNQLVFKACCHNCGDLIALDHTGFEHIIYDQYPDRYIDEIYGEYDPNSARFICPTCKVEWSFEQKNKNIIKGKEFGFTDHTGKFSKGWHSLRPEITEVFGFAFSELMSPFSESNFVELTKHKIKAEIALALGNELPMKSYYNNTKGQAYSSGITSMEAEEMKKLRKNYPEGIVPYEGLILTAGIDVQKNRLAIIIRAWGRNGNSYLITWKEIFGDPTDKKDRIWEELTQETVLAEIPHVTGKKLRISAISIDSAAFTEVVYEWVLKMQEHNQQVFATRGVKDLKHSDDEIYKEPEIDLDGDKKIRKSLAETMGVSIFQLGAHRAHDEILRRVNLNKKPNVYSEVYHFNNQSYGGYEEQMTSCKKIVQYRNGKDVSYFKLPSGKRKEAIDAEKMALHAAYAIGIRHYTDNNWNAIENWLYDSPVVVL